MSHRICQQIKVKSIKSNQQNLAIKVQYKQHFTLTKNPKRTNHRTPLPILQKINLSITKELPRE